MDQLLCLFNEELEDLLEHALHRLGTQLLNDLVLGHLRYSDVQLTTIESDFLLISDEALRHLSTILGLLCGVGLRGQVVQVDPLTEVRRRWVWRDVS